MITPRLLRFEAIFEHFGDKLTCNVVIFWWVAGLAAPITREHLLVEDADTPADEIVFKLLTVPTNGKLVVDGVDVTNFTQQLINDNRVQFHHTGGLFVFSS